MNRRDAMRLLTEEKADLVEFLESLEAPDWEKPSLCDGWTIRRVAAHLASSIGLTRAGLATRALRYGSGTDGANERSAVAWEQKGDSHIINTLSDPKLLGLGFFYPRWALCEAVVHHQDMRRALDRPREIPVERLVVAIEVLLKLPFLTGAGRQIRTAALRPTDIAWSHGAGAEVRGRAEAILMALAGRRDAIDQLEGDGLALLARN